jgi:hypothetical protein
VTDINAKYDNSPLSEMNSKNWLDSCNFILTSNSAQFAKHLSIVSSLHIITIIQCPCLGIFCTIQLPTHLNRNTLQKRKSNNNQTFFFKIMLIFSLLNLLALVFSTQFIYQHITREQLHKIIINITQMRILLFNHAFFVQNNVHI